MTLFYCQIFAASLCFATSGLAMKFSEGLTKPLPSLVLALLVLIGAGFQALAMRYAGLGTTYLIVVGLEAMVATLLGITFFQEGFSPTKALALVLVLSGLALLR